MIDVNLTITPFAGVAFIRKLSDKTTNLPEREVQQGRMGKIF